MAEEEGVELFLRRRFPDEEQLIQTWVAKLASEGFVSLTGLKAARFQQLRELGLPRAFAIRLDDEGYLSSSQPLRRKSLQPRTFCAGGAISLDEHYYCPWPHFDGLVADIISGNWLLLTGPWQSGKTSLLNALGLALQERGYLVLLTTLDDFMVDLGSNREKAERIAAGDFYTRLANKVCDAAGNELQRPAGMVESVVDLFKVPKGGKFRDVIWLVDEAQLLNQINHETGYAVHNLLSGLREAKRESVSRTKLGTYRLHSFCLILACIDSLDGSADVSDLDTVLEAIADGVLEECGTRQVRFTSPLLLSTILESCKFAPLQVIPASTESLLEVYETAITLMNPDAFLRPKVLNSSGQPSEYIIQSQLFRSLMFLMERGVYTHKYNVFVEVKERDENGVRTKRMDGYMENAQAPKQGLEIEVGKGRNVRETRKTVRNHLERSVYYKQLHSCEMNYMYFWVGDSDATGARLVMEELRDSFSGVTCWYVNYMPGERAWTIERLKDDGKWVTMRKNVAPEFPRFLLSSLDAGKRCNF